MHDYNVYLTDSRRNGKRQWSRFWPLTFASCAAVLAFVIAKPDRTLHAQAIDALPETVALAETQIQHALHLPPFIESASSPDAQTAPPALPSAPTGKWEEHVVASGDTLSEIFTGFGLGPREVYEVVSVNKETRRLNRIRPGQRIRVQLQPDGKLATLVYDYSRTSSLEVRNTPDGMQAGLVNREIELRTAQASATIRHSLFLAAQRAGLSQAVTMELAGIFGWDIDFALDVREGDAFSLVYEQQYLNGAKLRDGAILAAEFINRGKTYRAVRYTDSSGRTDYYGPEGRSMRKAFLRSPVDFTRISSRFSTGRRHPILNRIRAHRGVDYAAARGTPIRATGDGKIVHRARKGGYGKTVMVQHGSRYRTLYAHLSRYAKPRTGSRVRQGQIIGYVGSTGLATGAHLHYEFLVNGVHRNPLTVKLPAAKPIAKQHKADFLEQTAPLISQLDLLKSTLVALNQ